MQRGAQRRPARRAPREAFADGSKAKVRGARQSALGAFPPPIKKVGFGDRGFFIWARASPYQTASSAILVHRTPFAVLALADRYISPGITAGGCAGVMYDCLSVSWATRISDTGGRALPTPPYIYIAIYSFTWGTLTALGVVLLIHTTPRGC